MARKKMVPSVQLAMGSWGLRNLLAERMHELEDGDLRPFVQECRKMVDAVEAELYARTVSRRMVGAADPCDPDDEP